MKKLFLLFTGVLFLCGCSVEKIDTSNTDNLVSYMTSKNYNIYNRYSMGYKYYLPKSVSVVSYTDYNEQLLSNGDIYYLYVDIISYYHKNEIERKDSSDYIYYKEIDNGDKKGYIKVEDYGNNRYYVTYKYNYSSIESIINKDKLDNTIINMSYILTSIDYNDTIIKSLLENNKDITKEEAFKIKKPNNKESTFLDYVNTYDKYKDDKDDDEDKLIDEATIKQSDEMNE